MSHSLSTTIPVRQNKGKNDDISMAFQKSGGPGRTRTYDQTVMSGRL